MITITPEICSFQQSHIWDAGHRQVQAFWVSQSIKHPISPSLLKCYIMFMEYLRIIENGFSFRDIILLTSPKKGTLHMRVFTVNLLLFIMLSSIYRYLKYIKETIVLLHFRFSIIALSILQCNVFSDFVLAYINSSWAKFFISKKNIFRKTF